MHPKTLDGLLLSLLLLGLPASAMAGGGHDRDHHAHQAHEHVADTATAKSPAKISRTIDINMNDQMRFEPAHLDIRAGETVRFRVTNSGQLPHEMVIGTLDDLQAHAEQMRNAPDMAHDEPNALALDAGTRGELIWHFSEPATLDFACLIAGHLEAGMKGSITVR